MARVRTIRLLLVGALLVTAAPAGERPESVRCGFAIAEHRFVDLDGDGRDELILVGKRGRLRVWSRARQSGELRASGKAPLQLSDPERTLLALGDFSGRDGKLELAALTHRGLFLYVRDPRGGFLAEPRLLERAAKFTIRVGTPRFARILTDINRDGSPDLLVPKAGSCELWLQENRDGAGPSLRKIAEFATELRRQRKTAGRKLSDRLESGFRVPTLAFQDMNGDKRLDLVVVEDMTRAFHLQRPDGTLPAEPDAQLDLKVFRDTTPGAEIRLGRTLAGGETARLTISDLDGNGIPDYVITHRRKLWVFHGSTSGPQFTRPTSVLRTAEDVTAALVVPLDDDRFPDLLLVRVHVPTVASLLRALYTSIDIDLSATGYTSRKGLTFAKTPTWRGGLSVRLPKIIGIIRNPETLVRRMEDTASKFRGAVTGDFDGDGTEDLALPSEDGKSVGIWKAAGWSGQGGDFAGLRSLFFESKESVWTIERVLEWLGEVAERRTASMTGGRAPDLSLPLRDGSRLRRVGLMAADTDGDGRRELVVLYVDPERGAEGVLDFHRIR